MPEYHYPTAGTQSAPRFSTADMPRPPAQSWSVREQGTTPRIALRSPADEDERKSPVHFDVEAFLAKAVHRGLQVLLALVSAVGLLLLTRILLIALNASTTAPFVQFVYDRTAGLVDPFHSMFRNADLAGHPIELDSIVAIVVYGIALAIVVKIIEMFLSPNRARKNGRF